MEAGARGTAHIERVDLLLSDVDRRARAVDAIGGGRQTGGLDHHWSHRQRDVLREAHYRCARRLAPLAASPANAKATRGISMHWAYVYAYMHMHMQRQSIVFSRSKRTTRHRAREHRTLNSEQWTERNHTHFTSRRVTSRHARHVRRTRMGGGAIVYTVLSILTAMQLNGMEWNASSSIPLQSAWRLRCRSHSARYSRLLSSPLSPSVTGRRDATQDCLRTRV